MYLKSICSALIVCLPSLLLSQNEFQSKWPTGAARVWTGPEFWANPLQAWRIDSGRLRATETRDDQNVHLLTHQLSSNSGTLNTSVQVGHLSGNNSWGGFRIGIKGAMNEYRFNTRYGKGVNVGMRNSGELFIKNTNGTSVSSSLVSNGAELRLGVVPSGNNYRLTLTAHNQGGNETARVAATLTADEMVGNIALVSHGGRYWFEDWKVSGTKLTVNNNHTWGPILWTQYTLSGGTLKLLAILGPMGAADSKQVSLQTRKKGETSWGSKSNATLDMLSFTALFRNENWESDADWEYRISYSVNLDGSLKEYEYIGEIPKEPLDRDEIVVAGFTGHKDYMFPNIHVAENVEKHNPDVLFFSGDQLYEGNGGYGIVRSPLAKSSLDYLRKYYQLGWSFGHLMKNRPTVLLVDDHDVYQGNIWGHGGRKTNSDVAGGFIMEADFVNLVQRTQTSHLPDPFDPTPVTQGIGVYYTSMTYGGISFAVIEDRKWKSGPNSLPIYKDGGRVDHINFPPPADWDPAAADVTGAVLLGDRQLNFLNTWAKDWKNAYLKVVLSASVFSQVTSMHGGPNSRLTADFDSNAWPQTGRNKALDAIRKGFGFMLAGDTHLPTIIHHGVEEWRDGGFSFSVPSIAAGYPRGWIPTEGEKAPGWSAIPNRPNYTGDFYDGFGNKATVWSAANPEVYHNNNQMIANAGVVSVMEEKNSGYGIVRLNKVTRKIDMEAYYISSGPGERQMNGWPLSIDMEDNYGREPTAYLPTLNINTPNAVVQVINESTGDVIYTLRVKGNEFKPKVFDGGPFTVKVGELGTGKEITLTNIVPDGLNGTGKIDVVVPIRKLNRDKKYSIAWDVSKKSLSVRSKSNTKFNLRLVSPRGKSLWVHQFEGPGIYQNKFGGAAGNSLIQSGIYLLQIKGVGFQETRRILILN